MRSIFSRNATPPYAFPETRIVKHLVHDLPLRVSALRTPGAYANVFAAESFLSPRANRHRGIRLTDG